MDINYLRALVDFHYWARDRVLDAVSLLDGVQYAQPVGGSFGSIRDTLNHTFGAEVLWLRRWHGESPTSFPGSMPDTVASLRAAWKRQEAELRTFVRALDDQGLQRVIAYRNLAGVAGESAMWEMIAHVVNHATYHRGQVTTMLRQLGAAPPKGTDLIAYFRERSSSSTPQAPVVDCRAITVDDADVVAAMHATSWRRAYRGILTDDFLGASLDEERRTLWREKLAAVNAGSGWMALVDGQPAGFIFVRPGADDRWGTLVDNLHVLAPHQGLGIGRRLLHTAGTWATAHAPAAGMHLWVFADNTAARGFYSRMGGSEVELVDRAASDGRMLPEYRVAWNSPSDLARATSPETSTEVSE